MSKSDQCGNSYKHQIWVLKGKVKGVGHFVKVSVKNAMKTEVPWEIEWCTSTLLASGRDWERGHHPPQFILADWDEPANDYIYSN